MCTPPKALSVAATSAPTDGAELTSVTVAIAVPPAARMLSTTAEASSRSQMLTAPLRPRARARMRRPAPSHHPSRWRRGRRAVPESVLAARRPPGRRVRQAHHDMGGRRGYTNINHIDDVYARCVRGRSSERSPWDPIHRGWLPTA